MPINIDKDVDLTILLKELDHIQAIIGRYDTFFFLMKQVCLASVFGILGVFLTKTFGGVGYVALIPALFYLYEFGFRCAYWSEFIFRALDVESALNSGVRPEKVYVLNAKRGFRPRAKRAFTLFDLLFYVSLVLLLFIFSEVATNKPWTLILNHS